MLSVKNLVKRLGAGVLCLGLVAGMAGVATAHDYGYCHQVWVTSYVTREVPVQISVVRYDECGHPYTVYKTIYKTISVPVKKLVTVCD